MNLNQQPTTDELARLFAARKDSLDSHILWVSAEGDVHIDCLSPCSEESEFGKDRPNMRARLKMYRRGHGYVGKKAAADTHYMERVLSTLTEAWQKARAAREVHVVDRYC